MQNADSVPDAEPAWKACHADVFRAANDLEGVEYHHDKGRRALAAEAALAQIDGSEV